jgi:DNA-directed RNA polymerase specialized sigma24 family protein
MNNADSPLVRGSAAWEARIDQICDRFEDACRLGQRPGIDEFLHSVGVDRGSADPDLLRELARVDAAYAAAGAHPGQSMTRSAVTFQRDADSSQESAFNPDNSLQIPGYEILDVLGQGGMGVVYRARQIALNRIVAIKMIRFAGHSSDSDSARFKAEAAAIARLQHLNVVQVYEIGTHQELPYFSLEFCGGGSLKRRLALRAGSTRPAASGARSGPRNHLPDVPLQATGRSLCFGQGWNAYFARLIAVARSRLRAAPRAAADEEDVALSAFDSFCRGAEAGRFPRLDDRDDLWRVLFVITDRKAAGQARREGREKRGGGRVVQVSAVGSGEGSGADVLGGVAAPGPSPEFAAQLVEECERLLSNLNDGKLRQLAIWKMEGFANAEIAEKLSVSVPTIERKLARIRNIWQVEAPE